MKDSDKGQSQTMQKMSSVVEERFSKSQRLKDMGVSLYPAGYPIDTSISDLLERFGHLDGQALEKQSKAFVIAGVYGPLNSNVIVCVLSPSTLETTASTLVFRCQVASNISGKLGDMTSSESFSCQGTVNLARRVPKSRIAS